MALPESRPAISWSDRAVAEAARHLLVTIGLVTNETLYAIDEILEMMGGKPRSTCYHFLKIATEAA